MRFRPSEDDFEVEEVPLPGAPSAGPAPQEGSASPGGSPREHVPVWIEKRGLSTHEAIRRIAQRLSRSAADFGYAGLKDAHAVTRQWITIPGLTEAERARVDDPCIRALSFGGPGPKLTLGALAGNRFRMRLRDAGPEDEARAREALAAFATSGVPNFFGRQRFGIRGLGARIGKAILLGEAGLALDYLLGAARPVEGQRLRDARVRYERGDIAGALRTFPVSFDAERCALEALVARATPAQALEAVPWKTREVYLHAYQASLFNRLLEERVALGTYGVVEAGDVVLDEPAPGAPPSPPRLVRNAAPEAERARAFAVSPAGPLAGHEVLRAEAAPGRRESILLAAEAISWVSFRRPKGLALRGARKAYRFQVRGPSLEREDASTLTLRFELPSGCYATTVVERMGVVLEESHVG